MAYNPTKSQGQTTDDIDPSVLGLPFLTLIQKGSPEFDETHRLHAVKKIPDCRPGNIIYGPKRRIMAQPLLVIPVAQASLYTEWKPRTQQGGFVANRPETVVMEAGYRKVENKEFLGDNELIYTIYVMFLFKDGANWDRGIISFTGTQLKHARSWLKTVKSVSYPTLPDVKPPIFAAQYQLSSAIENNAKGSWFGWSVKLDRVLDFTNDEKLLETAEAASVAAMQTLPKPDAPKAIAAPKGDVPY